MKTSIVLTKKQAKEVHSEKCPNNNPVFLLKTNGVPFRIRSSVRSAPGYPIKMKTVIEKLSNNRQPILPGDLHHYINCIMYKI